MTTPKHPRITDDCEARALEPGQVPRVRRWRPGDPESSLSLEEQEIRTLRAKAAFLREQADELDAKAASLAAETVR